MGKLYANYFYSRYSGVDSNAVNSQIPANGPQELHLHFALNKCFLHNAISALSYLKTAYVKTNKYGECLVCEDNCNQKVKSYGSLCSEVSATASVG